MVFSGLISPFHLFSLLKALINVSLDQFSIPGDVSFPLNQAYEAPRDRQDAEALRQYVFPPCVLTLIHLLTSLV